MKKIKTRVWILMLTLLLGTVSMFASGKKDYYSQGVAHSVPSGKGSVYVTAPSGGTNGSWSTTTSTANKNENVKDAQSHTYTFTASDNDPEGYSWTGWYDNENNANTGSSSGKQNNGAKTCTASVTATENSYATVNRYARWMPNTYTIRFHGNGETGGSMDNLAMTYDTEQALTSNGFEKVYTVSYDADGGNTAATTSANTTVSYSFDGWEDRGSIIYNNTTYSYTTFDAPYYANTYGDLMNAFGYNKYSLIQHYVNNGNGEGRSCKGATPGLYPNGATVNNLATAAGAIVDLYAHWSVTTDYVVLPNATKDNNVFDGWYIGEQKIGEAGGHYTPTADVTLKAVWTAKRTPKFLLRGVIDLPETPIQELHLLVKDTAHMSFVNTDETNNRFTYPTDATTIDYAHNSNEHTGVITAKAAGDEEITFHQTGTGTIFERTRKIHVYVAKHSVELSTTLNNTTMEVGDSIETSLYSLSVVPGEGEDAQNEVTVTSSNPNVLRFENGQWRAKNEGIAVLTIAQANNSYWTGDTITAAITVNKKTPVFTWMLPATISYNKAYTTPVTSTNDECSFTYTSNNTSVVNYANGALRSFAKSGTNVKITVTQAGNYKWKEHTEDFYVNVEKLPNHVELTINTKSVYDAVYTGTHAKNVSFNNNNEIELSEGAFDWDDRYIDINFEGVPKKLTFEIASTKAATGEKWYVKESADGTNWSGEIWNSEAEGKDFKTINDVRNLQPSTRYLRLCYSGNYTGYFRNVKITERKEIIAPATHNFGSNYVGNNPTEHTIDVDWYNVQTCNVSISGANADRFELVDNTINTSIDNYGTASIGVNYKHDVAGVHTATLTITSSDSPAKTATVTLNGTTEKAIQDFIWREDITPLPLEEPYEGAVYATSGLDVVLTAETPNIVEIDGTTITGVGVGTTRIFATQAGDAKWAALNETISVEVTNKHVQHIVWTDKLSNVKREKDKTVTKTLTAYSDADNSLPITYSLDEAASAFASVNNNTLTVTGWGTGYITANQAGNDSYVGVSKKLKLVSRDPDAGCDPLVLDEPDEKTLHTIDSEEFDLSGEPAELRFEVKCDAVALWGLWVYQKIGNSWNQIQYIERGDLGTGYKKFTMPVDINATKIKLSADAGSTCTRTFKNVEVSTAKYLKLKENGMDFSAVEYGQIKDQEFYIDYSNITGTLDVALKDASEQFEIRTTEIGEDCGEVNHNARVVVRFTGRTIGTENATIVLSNKDQRLEVPVSATVIQQQQVITWNQPNPANEYNALSEDVQLIATATSGAEVSFASSNNAVAEAYRKDNGEWWLNIKKAGTITVTASRAATVNYSAALDVQHTYEIALVETSIIQIPTATSVTPFVALSNSILENGVASQPGTFAWEDETIEATVGNTGYTVVFTPDNTDIYAKKTCVVVVPVSLLSQTITWNFDVTEMYSNANYTFDAAASSNLPVSYTSTNNSIAYVDGSNNLVILRDGEVTITAVQNGNESYSAATPIAKTFTIRRYAPTIVELPEAESMIIGHYLSDASLTGGRAELNGVQVSGIFAWKDGNTTYMGEAGSFTKGIIFTPSNTNLYESVESEMTVVIEKCTPVVASHTMSGSTITYGQELQNSSLSGTVTVNDTMIKPIITLEGTCAWVEPSAKLDAGENMSAKVRFTPTNTDWYNTVDFDVTLTVNQAEPVLNVTASDIVAVQKLSASVLTNNGTPGTCAWKAELNPNTATYAEGNYNLGYIFTPTNPNYLTKEGLVALHVAQGCVITGNNSAAGEAWENESNWESATTPNASDHVLVKTNLEIVGDVTVGALTIEKGKTIVVKDGGSLTITGEENAMNRENYGSIYIENGGKVEMTDNAMPVHDVVVSSKLGGGDEAAASGEIIGQENLDLNGNIYIEISFDPSGRISYGWYDFVVPFEVNMLTGISRVKSANDKTLVYGTDFVLIEADEVGRANGKNAWKRKSSGVLIPGKLYSISFDDDVEQNTFRFAWNGKGSVVNGNSYTAQFAAGTNESLRGWNGMGNGMLRHGHIPAGYKVQAFNHAQNRYELVEGNRTFAVGTAFFVQVAEAGDVNWTASEATNERPMYAPARVAAQTTEEFCIALRKDDRKKAEDILYFSASEDATNTYMIGHDLTKMGTVTGAKVAQMWTEKNGLQLCDVETPLYNGSANTPLMFFAPQAGEYTLSIEQMADDATLYLTYNGNIIWDLTFGPYDIELMEGTNNGYGLLLEAHKAPQVTTGMDETGAQTDKVRKVMIDNQLYLISPDGQIYDATGKKMR